jgi:hypothetical protein
MERLPSRQRRLRRPVSDTELLTRPLDLWVPEGYVFYSMLVMPHFSLAIALLLLTVRYAAIGMAENRLAPTIAAGVLCFALSFVHPYDVLIALGLAGGVTGLHSLRQRRLDPAAWRHVGVLLLIGSGPVLYNYWILNNNPGMQAWLVQNHSASPAPGSTATARQAYFAQRVTPGVRCRTTPTGMVR